MSGKQREGDNERRRALGRRAREQGRQPSEAEATLGAAKQFEHVNRSRRSGPPPEGARKPQRGSPASPPPPPAEPAPRFDPTAGPRHLPEDVGLVHYRDLVDDVGRRAGIDFDQASQAAEATVIALARALDDSDRQRLLDAVPASLRDDYPVATPRPPRDLRAFLDHVARMTLRSREQARYQAQAALSALAAQDRELVESLHIPAEIQALLGPPPTGGGVVDRTGHTATLSDAEVRAALARLPYWSGSRRKLVRSLVLPRDNLDRVIRRLQRLEQETGRGAQISRQDPATALIAVRTSSVDAVTAQDIELAEAVDAAIEEVGAGIASPPGQ